MTVNVRRGDLSDADLSALIEQPRIAWDIETTGLNPLTDRIGTCQIAAPAVGTIVVQMDAIAPDRLRDLLSAAGTTKVFHHAPFDLRFMAHAWKVQPANVACTKIASKLLDRHAPQDHYTLKYLLEQKLGVEISKTQRLSDWTAPELTDEQLAYAAGDVEHLLSLHDELCREMRRVGLMELYQSCIDFLPTRVELDLGDWPDVFAY